MAWLFPILIGNVLTKTNAPGTPPDELNYTWALVMLACLGVAAMLIGLYLKVVDKKKHLGLEEPNIVAPVEEIVDGNVEH